jgi:hypothetical protein
MTATKRTKPAADEAACPVAPLAREYAQLIRARRKLDNEAEAKALLACTEINDEVGPLSASYADGLLLKRKDVVESRARVLCATSRMGVAFQLLLSHCDHLKSLLPGAQWLAIPKAVRDISQRIDDERGDMLWSVYKMLTAGWSDPDLVALESIYGREGLTDAECIERVLKAVA